MLEWHGCAVFCHLCRCRRALAARVAAPMLACAEMVWNYEEGFFIALCNVPVDDDVDDRLFRQEAGSG